MIEMGPNLMNAIYAVCGTVFGIGCLILFWYLVKDREPINPLDKCLKNNEMWKYSYPSRGRGGIGVNSKPSTPRPHRPPTPFCEIPENMIKKQEKNK